MQNPSLSVDLTSSSSVFQFGLSSTSAMPITMVTFTTPNAGTNGWDFLVDSIVAQGVGFVIPEPSTIVMGGTALLFGLVTGWRRRRRKAA
jgi:MYXO-CTERM domain-containing protein